MYLSFHAWIILEATDICLSIRDKISLMKILQTMYPARQSIILGFSALLIGILGTDAILMDCQIGWKRHNNFCYKMGPFWRAQTNWTEAYDYCHSLGAKLPVPSDLQGDTNFINTTLEAKFHSCERPSNLKVWLGCSKELEGKTTCLADDQPGKCQLISLCNMKLRTTECAVEKKRVLCNYQLQKTPRPLQCQSAFKQDDTDTKPSCLLDHTYKDIPLLHPIQCCIACHKDPNCFSFNLSGKLCELNNATISQIDAAKSVIRMDNCTTYNIN